MTVNSLRLPAVTYSCLYKNYGRAIPFEELCEYISASFKEDELASGIFSTEREYQTRIMDTLVFLSDLKLIILNQLTDESCINLSILN
ncbi:hypothetical protein [Flavobacterium hungaricum]|uniref:Uncharacterized protein n=1 Tax=Flavobacterium hungaricum TaxID=2082725 RepID=A0ABR9TMU0_9FLAO|nr:hypothetical protein [Flavobacterium hungaricum]MBE8725962.1 hypothetical protein [Flavobacterium hungaricum]